ncbi:hypothetical protein BH20GEM2_BH20GEM2_08680 [soil metagenome]
MIRSAVAALLLVAACAPAPKPGPAPSSPPVQAAPAVTPTPEAPAAVEAPPGTDVFLAPLAVGDGTISIGQPANLTRRAGYDNQPAFTPDGTSILFTCIDAAGQADVYRYGIAAGTISRVTATPESEYSPTPLPDGGFSAVRVEADSTQRLWRFAADGSDPGLVLADVEPVGYHAWADDHTLALFVLGDPPTLQLADTRTGSARTLASGIGRSLNRIPGRRAISFVRRDSDTASTIMELDVAGGAVRPLIATVGGGDFHAWTPGGVLLMADGSKIYAWTVGATGWREVADLAPLAGITRLAVSPDGSRIALVAEDAP